MNILKGVSSRLLCRDRPDIAQCYYYKSVQWKPGYFASRCGGAPLSGFWRGSFSFFLPAQPALLQRQSIRIFSGVVGIAGVASGIGDEQIL